MFFLCHWSKKFQRRMANALLRSVYSPQETLLQPRGREKLYILTRGKVDVEACLVSNPLLPLRKALATLEISPTR